MPDFKLAAVYIRVSTEDQAELSPASQLETIRAWASGHGYLIPEQYIFVDEGISGRSAKKRPAFNDMIALAKEKDRPVEAILLWKFSRFARNQEESIFYKSMLRRNGVEVVSVSEPVIEGPFGSLIERIIEWMDEYYSIRLAGEVKRSMTVNAQRGVRQTPPPFGYRRGPKGSSPSMLPEPEEAEAVRQVFRDYLAGVPVWQIVEKLNARGLRTHRGGRIENRTVMYWLQNPVYVGKNRWTPTGKTRRDFLNPDSLVVPGDHEPLVSQEDFDAAQKLAAAASAAHRPKSRPSFELRDWMGGVVRCADCGSTLVFQKPRYFICNGYVRARCKSRQSITVEALHEAVLERLRADTASSLPLRYAVAHTDDSAQEYRLLRQQTEQYEKKLSRLRDAYLNGVDSLEDYRRAREALQQTQQELTARLAELEARSDPHAAEQLLRSAITATLQTLESPDADLHKKNAAVKSLFETCTWQKSTQTLSITYRVSI